LALIPAASVVFICDDDDIENSSSDGLLVFRLLLIRMIFFLQIQIYFSQKLYIVLKVTTTYFNNLIGILVHVGKSSNIVTHFDTVNYSLTG
jgi:hypothetical protein